MAITHEECPRCRTRLVEGARYCHACGVGIVAAASGEFAVFDLDRFFDYAVDMLCIAGVDGYFKRVNAAFEKTLGYTAEEMLTRPFVDFIHPDDRPETLAEVGKLSSGSPTLRFENRYQCKDGSYRDLQWTSFPEPGTGLLYAVARDVTEVRRHQDRIDGVTGLPSRRVLEDTIDEEWKRASRLQVPLALAFFDLDHLRDYNARLGHRAGDECLRQVAQVLRKYARRAGDAVARSGGGEFAFVMQGGLTAEQATAQVEIMRAAVEALDIPHPGAADLGCVTVSAGVVSCIPTRGEGASRRVEQAKEALAAAKQSGRNRVVCAASEEP